MINEDSFVASEMGHIRNRGETNPFSEEDKCNEIHIDKGHHEGRTSADRPSGPVGGVRHRL